MQAGDFSWSDYQITFDIKPLSGVNRNVFFRVTPQRTSILEDHDLPVSYSLNMETNRIILKKWYIDKQSKLAEYNVLTSNGVVNTVRIKVEGSNIKIYHNDLSIPVIDYTDTDSPILNGRMALATITGSASSELLYDNVIVESLGPSNTPSQSPLPTSTVSPSPPASILPTIVPTSLPTHISLAVPNLKQYEGGWEDEIYDKTNGTISDFGCALTSAAMLLQYYGNSSITPAALNDLLNNEIDGYLRNGIVNWLAISRISSPHLEYLRVSPSDLNILSELENNQPGIIKLPGHFVITKGETENSFSINDPGYYDRTELSSYTENERLALNTFKPSHTDLSYMMFVVDKSLVLQLFNENMEPVQTQNYIDSPIDKLADSEIKSGEKLSILLLPKPQNGKYKLRVSGNSEPYILDTYLYDKEGNVVKQQFKGLISDSETDQYIVEFCSYSSVSVTFDFLLDKLEKGYQNREIKNWRVYYMLKNQIKTSKRYYLNNKTLFAKLILFQVKKEINWLKPYFITPEFSQTILSALNSLAFSL